MIASERGKDDVVKVLLKKGRADLCLMDEVFG